MLTLFYINSISMVFGKFELHILFKYRSAKYFVWQILYAHQISTYMTLEILYSVSKPVWTEFSVV